jgi:putative oxidoreductase
MSRFEGSRATWTSRMLSVYRIVAGLIFLTAGTTIVLGHPAVPAGGMLPPFSPMTQLGIGGLIEIVGGLAIALGLFTRPVAFVLAGQMAVTYFQFHFPLSFFPTTNNGMPAVMFCFFFLFLVFAGAGEWSVDSMLARRRRDSSPEG